MTEWLYLMVVLLMYLIMGVFLFYMSLSSVYYMVMMVIYSMMVCIFINYDIQLMEYSFIMFLISVSGIMILFLYFSSLWMFNDAVSMDMSSIKYNEIMVFMFMFFIFMSILNFDYLFMLIDEDSFLNQFEIEYMFNLKMVFMPMLLGLIQMYLVLIFSIKMMSNLKCSMRFF